MFAVAGYPAIGMGHAYRATMIAQEMVEHDVVFACEERDILAIKHIRAQNYKIEVFANGKLLEGVLSLAPDLVVNDVLDTSEEYIMPLKSRGVGVVNFEDLGEGAKHADYVINALYPHQSSSNKVMVGYSYFCLRDEFIYLPSVVKSDVVQRILITFGGVDEANLTARVLGLLGPIARDRKFSIDIVVGPGFSGDAALSRSLEACAGVDVVLTRKTSRISEFMARADIAVTSGGRTVFELASVGVPTLVLCQNFRETTHTFAAPENGILNLGFHAEVQDEVVIDAFVKLLEDSGLRESLVERQKALDLTKGKKRVVGLINSVLFG